MFFFLEYDLMKLHNLVSVYIYIYAFHSFKMKLFQNISPIIIISTVLDIPLVLFKLGAKLSTG